MTAKELFLSLESYEDFDRHREKFVELVIDEDIRKHMDKIFSSGYAPTDMHREVYPPSGNFDDWD